MTFQFPPSPSIGQQVANGGVYYEWDGVKWDVYAWPEPPPPDMPSIDLLDPTHGSTLGLNLDANWTHIDAGYAATVRVRTEPTFGYILDFYLDSWAGAGSPATQWGQIVYVNSSGQLVGYNGMRAWNTGESAQGVVRFGSTAYSAYIWWNGGSYQLGDGMGLIWHEGGVGNNRGVRNSAGFNNMQMWYSADGQVHLSVDASYFGYMWFTENFTPANYNSKSVWGTNTFVKGNSQDITIIWDGNLQAYVGSTYVGMIYTTWNNPVVAWSTVTANMINSVRLAYAGDFSVEGDPYFGGVATGWAGVVTAFRFRYLQFLRNGAWHTAPYAS